MNPPNIAKKGVFDQAFETMFKWFKPCSGKKINLL